ncbi:MAG: 50S ribosomal protein L2 [Candidatus Thorarchaeota archaeon]|nr:MAG: 50S ribosomal protein L2 [Candidatus Thorarchaeota archaeon]
MGKRILVQRKGRGAQQFTSPSQKKISPARHPKWAPGKTYIGVITDLHHEAGRGAPLAKVRFNGESQPLFMVAPEGAYVGQEVECGDDAALANGNTLMLEHIPEGMPIYNIEASPGDGGKFVRASGLTASIISSDKTRTIVKLPSGAQKTFSPRCRATIGIVGGGGRLEKPLLKAGAAFHLASGKARKWPTVRGDAMNPVAHPHGGGSHQSPSHPTTVSRNAPPGAKVGHIAARRTGRKR